MMLLLLFLGVIIGLSSSLFGLGGNVFIIPILPLIIDIPIHSVVITGIFTVCILSALNCYFFYRQKLIDFKLIIRLLAPTFFASFLSSFYMTRFSSDNVSLLFSLVLFLMICKLNIERTNQIKEHQNQDIKLLLLGMISGFIAGIIGVGNGLILAPFLLSTGIVEPRKVSPTINGLIFISCLSASLSHLYAVSAEHSQKNLIRFDIVFMILIGAVVSSFLGRKLNLEISAKSRKHILTIFLTLLLFKSLYNII